jgi:hypothetical protein
VSRRSGRRCGGTEELGGRLGRRRQSRGSFGRIESGRWKVDTRRPSGRMTDDATDACSAQEHAMIGLAVEIAFSLDRAVILSTGLVQLYTDPLPWRKPRRAHEPHNRLSSVIELDRLSHAQRQTCHCLLNVSVAHKRELGGLRAVVKHVPVHLVRKPQHACITTQPPIPVTCIKHCFILYI